MSLEDSQAALGYWQILVPAVVSFLICAGLLRPFIDKLKKLQIQQFLREEGPKSHAHKAKTPTAGGLCFLWSTVLVAVGWSVFQRSFSLPLLTVLSVASVCGALGLADDLAKVRQKANKGVSERLRLAVETLTGITLGLLMVGSSAINSAAGTMEYASKNAEFGSYMILPRLIQHASSAPHLVMQPHSVPWLLTFLLATFLIPATTNAVNLHDGMDGLAAGTSFLILISMATILFFSHEADLAILSMIAAGGVLGFLLYNKYPAMVFMGDTGSLFLGGLLGALAAAGGILIWFVPLTLIYIVETLSVILQVVYFKLTKEYKPDQPMSALPIVWIKLTRRLPGEGKRLFRMAPLHHHFETTCGERGIPEWQVVGAFWAVQALICLLVVGTFFFTRPPS